MEKNEQRPVPPCVSLSAVTFHSQIDENELKSKSMWNPDWTIQKEVSITIDKSANETTRLWTKKTQILISIAIILALILLIVIPILIVTFTRNSNSQSETSSTIHIG